MKNFILLLIEFRTISLVKTKKKNNNKNFTIKIYTAVWLLKGGENSILAFFVDSLLECQERITRLFH